MTEAATPDPPGAPARVPEALEFLPADYFRVARLEEIFPGQAAAPFEIDIGCGDGSFLADLAAARPWASFLGIERLLGRVRKACRRAGRRGLENVRVLRLDSAYAVGWLLPDRAVARAHLLFPDPWPKKRHHRRRLVDADFVRGLDRILVAEGEWLFKSDHAECFDEAVATVLGSGLFHEAPWEAGGAAGAYPQTGFERQWQACGREIRRARFVRAGHRGA